MPHGGLNQEHALHLLHRCQGNLQKAILHLLENSLKLCVNDPLADYTYTGRRGLAVTNLQPHGVLVCVFFL